MRNEKADVVATGVLLVGKGIRSLYSVTEEILKNAQNEILIAVYQFSGKVSDFLRIIENSAERGIRITVVINRFFEQYNRNVIEFMKKLDREYDHVNVYSFEDKSGADLHMKVIVVDRSVALVGSANMTWKGMVENHELSVVLKGKNAEVISKLVENLITLSRHI